MKLHHVGLEVQDLYGMELFYRQVLGFGKRYHYVSVNTPGLRTLFLEREGLALELLERPRDPDFLGRRQVRGHLALAVADVDAECRRLAGLGWPGLALGAPRDTGDGFREAELRDPEGNVIELSARIAPEPHYPVRAVIFDLDGTLIDSEPNYFKADQQLMARFGITYGEADHRRYLGSGILAMVEDLVARHRLAADPRALAAEKNALYLEIAEHATVVYPEMRRFLDHLVGNGIPVAVASGSALGVIRRLVEVVGLGGSFAHLVSADEVAAGKPAPDVFLEAARRLGVPAVNCLAVEDSEAGVESARRAGMRCIAVPTFPDATLAPAFAMADLLVPEGMASFDPDRAWAWVQARS